MINQISWAFPLISLTPHLNTKQNIQRKPGIPSLTFSLLILHTSLHIRRSTRLAKLKQETFICSSVRFCFSQQLLPGYLGQPGQPRQSDRTRYLGLCVYGSLAFGLFRSPPVFSILFTTVDWGQPTSWNSFNIIHQFPGIITEVLVLGQHTVESGEPVSTC